MIPILYERDETSFVSNGLGRLRDCISCKVTEERNGIYECDFEYPITGQNYDKIQCGRIIGVTHEESDDVQPFDIVSYERPIDGVVTFHCTHISYRQSSMVTWATNINSLSDAFNAFETTCYPAGGNPFTYSSDKTSTGYVAAFDGAPRTIRSLLGGVEGSILDAYGGEYEWNKWNVVLHSARGELKDFTIRYGLNLTEFTDETDYSELYNTCIPYWVNSESGAVIMGGEVSSGRSSFGATNRCIPLDLTDKFEEQPSVSALQSMALDIMSTHQSYLPSQNIKIDFIRTQDSELQRLTKCKLCDSIRVIFPFYNMSGYYKIVKTVWNVLANRYDDMELGNLSSSLSDALGVSSSGSYIGSGSSGGGIHYGLRIDGHEITLVEGGETASVTVPDENTTYSLGGSGTTVTLTPSSGTAQSVTIPVPTKMSDLTNDGDFVSDASYVHTDNNFTTALKNKLDGIEAGAEVNVQSDWAETDSSADSYIQNKPVIPTVDVTDVEVNGTSVVTGGVAEIDLTGKQDTLVSGTNIKTINNESLLGSGNITIQGGGGSGTSVPTADTLAEFDSTAHMNSTDMTSTEVDDFVDSLDGQGSGIEIVRQTFTKTLSTSTWYGTTTVDITKSGYKPISVIASVNQVRYHCQVSAFTDTSVTVNVADYSSTGMNVTVTVIVTYVNL